MTKRGYDSNARTLAANIIGMGGGVLVAIIAYAIGVA
jgi:hypothetical protein